MNQAQPLSNSSRAGDADTGGGPPGEAVQDALCEQAYAEYQQRLRRGECPDVVEYISRFPACQSSLLGTILGDQYLNDLLGPDWPGPGNDVLGFRLLRELGSGAFARVFLAEQPALGGRLVVLKVCRLFHGEEKTLGRLEHRNVVPVNSVGHDTDRRVSVLCMPFLGRATLNDVRRRALAGAGPPRGADVFRAAVEESASPESAGEGPPVCCEAFRSGSYVDAVIDVARQLAEALAFVHARGVCHRDLKPSNVLLSLEGRPMLMDFNLSDDPLAPPPQERFGGTLPYMSPEQLRGVAAPRGAALPPIDGRADVYALGVVLFELLTGRHPCGPLNDFAPDEQYRQELLARQAEGVRPLRGLNPDVDRALEKTILRCLAFDPADRFASAAELAAALRKCQSPARRAVRWARRRPALVGVALAALLFGAAGGAYQSRLPSSAERYFEHGLRAYKDKDYAKAIDALSDALDQPSPPADAPYFRGRAFLHVWPPDHRRALEDFLRAEQIAAADPQSKEGYGKAVASAAFCCRKLAANDAANADKHRRLAIEYCDKAIKEGYASAIMYNNKGFIQAKMQGQSKNAIQSLTQAIQLDPALQVAFHNRARIDLQVADVRGPKYEPKDGIRDIEEAIRLGPDNPELHCDAFRLYVWAYKFNPRQNQNYFDLARAEIRKLRENGWLSRQMVEGDAFFRGFRAGLGVEIRDAELQDRTLLPIPQLFLDPVDD